MRTASTVPSVRQGSLGHDQNVVAQLRDIVEIVLDQAEGEAALRFSIRILSASLASSVRLMPAPISSSRMNDLGIAHQRPAEFDQFLLPARQVSGLLVDDMIQFQETDRLAGAVVDRRSSAA